MMLLILSIISYTLILMKNTSLVYCLLLVGMLLWCGMILLAPLAAYYGYSQGADILYTVFGRVCHQLDSHSLHLHGEKFGVCARCSSMYFGCLLGVVVYPLFKSFSSASFPHRRWLTIAAVPMGVDVFLTLAGIHTATNLTRLFTGGFFGFIIAFTIVPGLQLAISSLFSSSRRPHACKT